MPCAVGTAFTGQSAGTLPPGRAAWTGDARRDVGVGGGNFSGVRAYGLRLTEDTLKARRGGRQRPMSQLPPLHNCPDCDEALAFTFSETSGLSGWKWGEAVNHEVDTLHYVCFPCGKTWKQRLNGPLTEDVVGDLVFFSCGQPECGRTLAVTKESLTPTEVELACSAGHAYSVKLTDEGGLTLEKKDQPVG